MPNDPPKQSEDVRQGGHLPNYGFRPANDEAEIADQPPRPRAEPPSFRDEVAPLLDVLGYHLADASAPFPAPPFPEPPFVERRKAPRAIDRLAELDGQIDLYGDPSGLRHRLRRLLLSEMELLGVVGRRREDRPLAEVAARALRS